MVVGRAHRGRGTQTSKGGRCGGKSFGFDEIADAMSYDDKDGGKAILCPDDQKLQ
jgi:hypothetical protein